MTLHTRSAKIEQGQISVIKGTLSSTEGPNILLNRTSPTGELVINETVIDYDGKIDIIYTNPKGEKINRSTNIDSHGNFTDGFKPDIVGTWFVEAKYDGNDYFTASKSNLAIIYVDYRFPTYLYVGLIFLIVIILGPTLLGFVSQKTVNISEQNKKEKDQENKTFWEKIFLVFWKKRKEIQKSET